MKKLNPLFLKTEQLLSMKARLILAIDGNAASGKTAFAALLAEKYGGTVFHMDDFFLPFHLKTPDRLAVPGENIHWERFLQEVMIPLDNGKEISYKRYDCKTDSLSGEIRVKPGKLNIIEGVYSLNPNLSLFYDLKIFLEIGEKEQKERILKRDGPAMFDRYKKEWIPLENSYFSQLKIPQSCDFVLSVQDFL